jgi:hypothetical protein
MFSSLEPIYGAKTVASMEVKIDATLVLIHFSGPGKMIMTRIPEPPFGCA